MEEYKLLTKKSATFVFTKSNEGIKPLIQRYCRQENLPLAINLNGLVENLVEKGLSYNLLNLDKKHLTESVKDLNQQLSELELKYQDKNEAFLNLQLLGSNPNKGELEAQIEAKDQQILDLKKELEELKLQKVPAEDPQPAPPAPEIPISAPPTPEVASEAIPAKVKTVTIPVTKTMAISLEKRQQKGKSIDMEDMVKQAVSYTTKKPLGDLFTTSW